jgi:hypothetical protein
MTYRRPLSLLQPIEQRGLRDPVKEPSLHDWATNLSQEPKKFMYNMFNENVLTKMGSAGLHANSYLGKVEEGYNPFDDPELDIYQDYMQYFIHSRSRQETRDLIKDFHMDQQMHQASPAQIAGMLAGALTDPTSIFMFMKAGSWFWKGNTLQKSMKLGGALTGEEIIKQVSDTTRHKEMALFTAGVGFGLPVVLSGLKYAKNYPVEKLNKYMEMADADDAIRATRQGGSIRVGGVGADVPPGKEWAKNYDELLEDEGFLKTWLGKYGIEQGPFTPIFRTLQSGVLEAREMIMSLLESPLYQMKNKEFVSTTIPIENVVGRKMANVTMIIREVEKAYLDYLKSMGVKMKGPAKRIRLHFGSIGKPDVMSFRQFRQAITRGRMNGMKSDNEFVQQGINITQKRLYGPTGQAFDESGINLWWIKREVSMWERYLESARISNKGYIEMGAEKTIMYPEMIEKILDKLKGRLSYLEKNGSLAKNYINIMYNYDAIQKNPDLFRKIMKEEILAKNRNIGPDELDRIIDDLMNPTNHHKYPDVVGATDPEMVLLQNMLDEFKANKLAYEVLRTKNKLDKALKTKQKINNEKFFENLFKEMRKAGINTGKETKQKVIEQFYFQNSKGIDRYIKNLFDSPTAQKAKRKYIYEKDFGKISRNFKSRELNINYERVMDEGFIEDDIFRLSRGYFNSTVPDIEIAKIFGDPMAWGGQAGFRPGINQIIKLYDEKISKVKTDKQRIKLIKEKNQVIEDLQASRDLIKGLYGLPENPHSFTSKAVRHGKQYNALTMLTGWLAAVPDVGRLVMANGVDKVLGDTWTIMMNGMWKDIIKMQKNELNILNEAVDMFNGSRAAIINDIDTPYGMYSKFEKGTNSLTNFYFTYINAMNIWNTGVKQLMYMYNGSSLIEDMFHIVKQTGKKSTVLKTDTTISMRLANAFIDQPMAERIVAQVEKYGFKKGNFRMANFEKWDDAVAREHFEAAMKHESNIGIVTPRKGDVPLWMNWRFGSMLSQFKKFGVAATQAVLIRGLQEKDANFFVGVMFLVALGGMVDMIRTRSFGKDYTKKSRTSQILDALDRSAALGIFTDINRAIESATDNRFGLRPALGDKKPYGTSWKYKAGILGPSASQISNIADIMWDTGTGKYNHHTARNVRRLIPFQNVFYLDWIFDKVEKGLRF